MAKFSMPEDGDGRLKCNPLKATADAKQAEIRPPLAGGSIQRLSHPLRDEKHVYLVTSNAFIACCIPLDSEWRGDKQIDLTMTALDLFLNGGAMVVSAAEREIDGNRMQAPSWTFPNFNEVVPDYTKPPREEFYNAEFAFNPDFLKRLATGLGATGKKVSPKLTWRHPHKPVIVEPHPSELAKRGAFGLLMPIRLAG